MDPVLSRAAPIDCSPQLSGITILVIGSFSDT